uniref:Phospholipase A2 n=1 Tax=Ditylenchus dipsaci TaxID=166011 RepID=A0A915E2G3_9BILA
MAQLKSSVLCTIFFSHLSQVLSEEKAWTCGSGGLSEKFSEFLTSAICADRKEASNECCRAHDLCYENQEGQEKCDDLFCNCLQDDVISPSGTPKPTAAAMTLKSLSTTYSVVTLQTKCVHWSRILEM